MKKIAIILFMTFHLLACKNEPSVEENQKDNFKNEFVVNVYFKSNKLDMISLVLYNIEVDEFQKKWIQINEKIVQTDSIQTITANFHDNISKNFRINLGNKEEKEIEIETIEVTYGEKGISILPSDLKTYFKLNEFVIQDSITKKLIIKKVGAKLNPTIYLKTNYLTGLENNNQITN